MALVWSRTLHPDFPPQPALAGAKPFHLAGLSKTYPRARRPPGQNKEFSARTIRDDPAGISALPGRPVLFIYLAGWKASPRDRVDVCCSIGALRDSEWTRLFSLCGLSHDLPASH